MFRERGRQSLESLQDALFGKHHLSQCCVSQLGHLFRKNFPVYGDWVLKIIAIVSNPYNEPSAII